MSPLAERLRARTRQLGLSTLQVAEMAGVNRSFLYDILKGRSLHPSADTLVKVARVLRVDLPWLLTGAGRVEGEEPQLGPEERYVTIPFLDVKASAGGGRVVDRERIESEPLHFLRSWVHDGLRTEPVHLRILRVEGDSMEPTLRDGDIILVDISRTRPTPPGVFVLFDGLGLVAKRLEHIPGSDPPRVRIVADNPRYSPMERSVDEINVVGRVRWFGREM